VTGPRAPHAGAVDDIGGGGDSSSVSASTGGSLNGGATVMTLVLAGVRRAVAAVDPRDDPASVVAAERALLELWTVLAGFADASTIVGGSAPPLLIGDRAEDPYIGTLDVDLVVDPISVPDEAYRTIAELLRERGYVQLGQPFRWLRSVEIDGRSIDVEVDLLAPASPRPGAGHRHERIGGEPVARRTEGAELVRAGLSNARSPAPCQTDDPRRSRESGAQERSTNASRSAACTSASSPSPSEK